ncbi:sugar ABC transporter substrate-binding protein [Plantactinospora sp. WMMC1484]|uniref:sugar ABC transporter substrate-binding protein n=1 Tax=Plantactinospora sp. WMMC1484 TaxID=3404122 RepID=UPI003BF4FF70
MSRAMRCGVALVSTLALATACDANSDNGSDAGSGPTYTIGLANQQESVTFPAAIAQGVKDEAAKRGIRVVDLDSQGDQARQASQVQDLIAQQVDAILLVPLSPGPAQALVDRAAAAEIPIATVHGYAGADRKVEDPYPKLAFVLDENEAGAGGIAGDMALRALPDGGKVAIVLGAAGFVENTTRVTQFEEKLAGAGAGRYSVVASQPGDWTKEKGQAACQNMLAANPDLGLVYALSDDMAVGCAAAVRAAGSSAKIIGVGGSRGGIEAIRAGDVYGTVCYKPYTEGVMAVQMMHDVLTGKLTGPPKTTFYDTPGITAENASACTPEW